MKRKKITADILLSDSKLIEGDIEKAIKRNLERMSDKDSELKQVHQKLIKTLEINSMDECLYYDFAKFKDMFFKLKKAKEDENKKNMSATHGS